MGEQPGAGSKTGVSRKVVALVLVPTLAAVAFLTVWAYQMGAWTWFALLIAAGIGLIAFVAAPDLFSINDDKGQKEYQTPTIDSRRVAEIAARRASVANTRTPGKAPNRTA